ncbi:magnesium transporter MgtE N-terminal domain-containing protein [Granulicoccus sp. GXG6511]|uniref:magnesium transporter MgtE N-terminal domain-containing protein n=1 Tax=Granulicoccus sp. GXG6511 TaxID=3381351 RepID=UPI003D7C68D1
MTHSTSIFISRLRGLPVVESGGDQIGKVRDVVIQVRTEGRAPRAKGLVVELFARQRIFVNTARVYSVDAMQVVISGTINTRRFSRHDAETLVIDGLFDRRVRRAGSPDEWTVYDISMREVRAREWELSEVALAEVRNRGFRRKPHVTIVDWSDVDVLRPIAQIQDHEQVLAELEDMHAADVARELHDMDPERRARVVDALDDAKLADALEELPEDEQIEVISAMEVERAADILEEMDPDDAADLIAELAEEKAEELLSRMQPEDASDVRRLLVYEEYTAGGLMTPEPVIMAPDARVADALAMVRIQELTPALAAMVHVCRPPLETPTGRYLGSVHIQRLLREPPSTLISHLIDSDLEPLPPDAPIGVVSRHFATYNLVNAAVVDSDQHLLGAVTVDDVLDHMLPDDWRGEQMEGQ